MLSPSESESVLKDDFFAVTRLVRDATGDAIVLKESRTRLLAWLRFRALDRWLSRRESSLYEIAARVPGVPAFLGRRGPASYAHRYVDGVTIDRYARRVPDSFFDDLERIVDGLHELGLAYVDMAKDENVIVGDDGRAYLIDFQISLRLPKGRVGRFVLGPIVRHFQAEDRYHLAKQKRLYRPDLLTDRDRETLGKRSWLNRLHRRTVKPLYNGLVRHVLRLPRSRPGHLHGRPPAST
ncbi:MAG: hypothetical protein HYR85_09280 [Planctomycetes bacterium]|nr:hypothetical protein [Planctomycetota bacterium]